MGKHNTKSVKEFTASRGVIISRKSVLEGFTFSSRGKRLKRIRSVIPNHQKEIDGTNPPKLHCRKAVEDGDASRKLGSEAGRCWE